MPEILATVTGRFRDRAALGVNGVITILNIGDPATTALTAEQVSALEAANFEVEPYYLPLGSATGDIIIPSATSPKRPLRLTVNEVGIEAGGEITTGGKRTVIECPLDEPFTPPVGLTTLLTQLGIPFTAEHGTLSLDTITSVAPLAVDDDATAGAAVGTLDDNTSGSTLVLGGADAANYALDGLDVKVSEDAELEEGTDNITVTEKLPGYVGSPKATPFTVTVSAAGG